MWIIVSAWLLALIVSALADHYGRAKRLEEQDLWKVRATELAGVYDWLPRRKDPNDTPRVSATIGVGVGLLFLLVSAIILMVRSITGLAHGDLSVLGLAFAGVLSVVPISLGSSLFLGAAGYAAGWVVLGLVELFCWTAAGMVQTGRHLLKSL